MEPEHRTYRIGYALALKKQKSFIQPSLIDLAQSRGIALVPIDPSLPLSPQGPFDAVLHKISGDPFEFHLRRFLLDHPSVPVLDPPDSVARLRNRISMLRFVSGLPSISSAAAGPHTFGVPHQVACLDAGSLSAATSLRFPVIAKPYISDGSAKSHKMALVFNRESLAVLKPPLVLQEFVNHGGVIFKVYVVGDYVRCVKRKSLPDISDLERHEGSVSFSQVSNMTDSTADRSEAEYYEAMHLEGAEMPPAGLITKIAKGLRNAMGLRLFNFDVIRDVGVGNHYLVIDINYFPGYAKMPGYEKVLTDFFWNVVREKQLEDGSDSSSKDDLKRGF